MDIMNELDPSFALMTGALKQVRVAPSDTSNRHLQAGGVECCRQKYITNAQDHGFSHLINGIFCAFPVDYTVPKCSIAL
jgi:hypothetical protein